MATGASPASTAAAQVELVDPPPGSKAGDRVVVANCTGEPDAVLNPKHKIFEAVKAELTTDGEGVVRYRGAALETARGPCRARTVFCGTVG